MASDQVDTPEFHPAMRDLVELFPSITDQSASLAPRRSWVVPIWSSACARLFQISSLNLIRT
jgi:hypothetical protein